jgi:hypothetical protein
MYYLKGSTGVTAWPYTIPLIPVITANPLHVAGAPDNIILSADMFGTDSSVDCLNAAVTTLPVTNTFSINVANAQLTCTTGSGATGVILDNVEDMQILIGENLNPNGPGPHRYVTSDTANINWNRVDTVRICLLLRTAEPGLTTTAQAYTPCSSILTNSTTTATSNDGRIRQAFSDTINIRSRTP